MEYGLENRVTLKPLANEQQLNYLVMLVCLEVKEVIELFSSVDFLGMSSESENVQN